MLMLDQQVGDGNQVVMRIIKLAMTVSFMKMMTTTMATCVTLLLMIVVVLLQIQVEMSENDGVG